MRTQKVVQYRFQLPHLHLVWVELDIHHIRCLTGNLVLKEQTSCSPAVEIRGETIKNSKNKISLCQLDDGIVCFSQNAFSNEKPFLPQEQSETQYAFSENQKANKNLFVVGKGTHNLVALLMMSDDNREKIDVFEATPWRYFKPAFVDGVIAGPNSICCSS